MLQARKLAPAIRAARCARLGDRVAAAKGAGSDHMHVQAMGGHFVSVPREAVGAGADVLAAGSAIFVAGEGITAAIACGRLQLRE
jgi:pentose-5-phosphate-3-epimerase